MFVNFGERLIYIDNNASAAKIVEWKSSEKTKTAYEALYTESALLVKIGYSVFKQYKNKDIPITHCAYIFAICDILLNPKSVGIKCNDKSVVKRVNAFLVNIFTIFWILLILKHITSKIFIKQNGYKNNEPVTPELMGQIAEEEAETMDAHKKRKETLSSQPEGSEAAIDDDDDYDNLVS